MRSDIFHGIDIALGKSGCPEEFTQSIKPEHLRAKAVNRTAVFRCAKVAVGKRTPAQPKTWW